MRILVFIIMGAVLVLGGGIALRYALERSPAVPLPPAGIPPPAPPGGTPQGLPPPPPPPPPSPPSNPQELMGLWLGETCKIISPPGTNLKDCPTGPRVLELKSDGTLCDAQRDVYESNPASLCRITDPYRFAGDQLIVTVTAPSGPTGEKKKFRYRLEGSRLTLTVYAGNDPSLPVIVRETFLR